MQKHAMMMERIECGDDAMRCDAVLCDDARVSFKVGVENVRVCGDGNRKERRAGEKTTLIELD